MVVSVTSVPAKFTTDPATNRAIAVSREPSLIPDIGSRRLPNEDADKVIISLPANSALKLAFILQGIMNGDDVPPAMCTPELRALMHELKRATPDVPIPRNFLTFILGDGFTAC